MHQMQTGFSVQGFCHHTKPLEAVQEILLDAFQPGFSGADILGINAEGDILGLGQAIVALGQLTLQHPGIFSANIVEIVALERDEYLLFEIGKTGADVQKGELKADGTVKVV